MYSPKTAVEAIRLIFLFFATTVVGSNVPALFEKHDTLGEESCFCEVNLTFAF